MSLTKTVQQEINRLLLESTTNKWIVSNEAPYYFDLCSVEDKTITLSEFYKQFPYYNPDSNCDYWKQQHERWENIWKQNTI
jgi:hypothetical protein